MIGKPTAHRANPLKGLLGGFVAGGVASAPMDLYWWLVQGTPGARPEQRPRPGSGMRRYEPATQIIAGKVGELLMGHELPEDKKPAAGVAAHYAFGVGTGAIYGLLAAIFPRLNGAVGGMAYGIAIWAGFDEWLLRVLRVAPEAEKVPLDQHLKAVGAHLVWGGVMGLLTRKLVR